MTLTPFTRGIVLILVATSIWGGGGFFISQMVGYGLAPAQVVFYANLLTMIVLLGFLLIWSPRYLKVPFGVLPEILVVGSLNGAWSFVLFAIAVSHVGMSLTMLLNFTAPAWVALLGFFVLREPVGPRRIAALACAFAGCALLARIHDPASLTVNLLGIACAVGSGIAWAFYQVFGKRLLRRYHPLTLTFYSVVAGALALLPFQTQPLPIGLPSGVWPWLLVFVFGCSLLGPIAFNIGLRLLQTSLTSMLMVWELIIAVGLGVLLLGERMDPPQMVGAALMAASVVLLTSSSGAARARPAETEAVARSSA